MKFSSRMERCELSPMHKFAALAAEAERRGKKVIHLNVGQPDIPTPAAYYRAAASFSQRVLRYAPSQGDPELLGAVRRYYEGIRCPLEPSMITITAGGTEALQIAFACLLEEGDEILVPEPFYPNYNVFLQLTGAVIRPLATFAEEGYRYADRRRIQSCINRRTRAILVTHPGNPTGIVLSRVEMQLLADIAKENDLFLLCDEVYREFVYDGLPVTSFLQLSGCEENIIVIDSVSKRFSACGARVGCLISRNTAFMEQAMKWCQGRMSAASLEQSAAAALYAAGDGYFGAVRREYQQRRDLMLKKLADVSGAACHRPQGAFYVMTTLPVDDTDLFQRWLLTDFDEAGATVMFAPGKPFYATPGKGSSEIRLAYVEEAPELSRALDILQKGVRAYNGEKF